MAESIAPFKLLLLFEKFIEILNEIYSFFLNFSIKEENFDSGSSFISSLFSNTINFLLNNLESNEKHFKSGSCILFDNELSINPSFCKYIDNLTKVRKINLNSLYAETNSINDIVAQITHSGMKKSITVQNLEKL